MSQSRLWLGVTIGVITFTLIEVGFGSESAGNGIGEPLGGRGGSLLDDPGREGAGGPAGRGTDKP